MSTSGLKLPTSTELEGRVREALKVARRANSAEVPLMLAGAPSEVRSAFFDQGAALRNIIRILEDGRS